MTNTILQPRDYSLSPKECRCYICGKTQDDIKSYWDYEQVEQEMKNIQQKDVIELYRIHDQKGPQYWQDNIKVLEDYMPLKFIFKTHPFSLPTEYPRKNTEIQMAFYLCPICEFLWNKGTIKRSDY